MKKTSDQIIFSPSDLIRYVASPYSSWMDRYYLENPTVIIPDTETEDQILIAQTGDQHEQTIFEEFKQQYPSIAEIPKNDAAIAKQKTIEAFNVKTHIIYQAALESDRFAGYSDFLIIDENNKYKVWDTKLARSPKPYYAIQLCCYSEMLANTFGVSMPEKFGIILGTKERVEFRVEDFIHYYRKVKASFLAMQDCFTGNLNDCPEPIPGADHGRWNSYAKNYFEKTDHLVRVAGITIGQIKKLKEAGIMTMTALAACTGRSIKKIPTETLDKLAAQARLQCQTCEDRMTNPEAPARYEILSQTGINGEVVGLAALPPDHQADVFFDMEGYPLLASGLEYLFGVISINKDTGETEFMDWWAHNREEEKIAFESFIDWVFDRFKKNPSMHIYHYASYEVSAVRRLSTFHDTRQDEVDKLLRNNVFIDLYKIVRKGLRIGEDSYSIKSVEQLYRPRRSTEVATAVDSIVQYARWLESKQSFSWKESRILKDIRDYNEDDCRSTAELLQWLRKVALANKMYPVSYTPNSGTSNSEKELSEEVTQRLETIANLRKKKDPFSIVLGDLIDFHRREEKPMWWRMFDREQAMAEELYDDSGCIEGVQAIGSPVAEKQSFIQSYKFDATQECKLSPGDKTTVMFRHNLDGKFTLVGLDMSEGLLQLKAGKKVLNEKFGGRFPKHGSLIPYEFVPAAAIQKALTEVGEKHLSGNLPASIASFLDRTAPTKKLQDPEECTTEAAIRIANSMSGGCLVIQGPPGTGKTYTAAHVINMLLAAGKKVGVASNSHKAIVNLLVACGDAARETGDVLQGIKVGGDAEGPLYASNRAFKHVDDNKEALATFRGGVVGGTAWLFSRPEWEGVLDFLFIDEAGQVSLANSVAIARSAKNIVLLGDQMQLEQPIQGTHPGDAGLSSLQYALKDLKTSTRDAPIFHAVVSSDYGLFLGESRRMHPSVCRFISESIYEGRLGSYSECANQKIIVPPNLSGSVSVESGIVFSGVEHDGNIQQSDEEIKKIIEIYNELIGRSYTATDGSTRLLSIKDFLFIAPYNAQVRALKVALPAEARVGSVDKFQGQEAPVCILSLCSSYGEYGSRGLAFILDRNRINVAISRAQCLAVIVADPRIANATASSINEMMLLNLFCKLTS